MIKMYQRLNVMGAEEFAVDPVINLFRSRMYYNTATNKYRFYNGSAWGDIDAGAVSPSVTLIRTLTANVLVNNNEGQLFIGPIVPNTFSITVNSGGEAGVIGPLTIQPGGTVTVNSGGLMRIL